MRIMVVLVMWKVLLLVISLQTGETVFSVHKLGFNTQEQCLQVLARVEVPYEAGFVVKSACIYLEPGQDI